MTEKGRHAEQEKRIEIRKKKVLLIKRHTRVLQKATPVLGYT